MKFIPITEDKEKSLSEALRRLNTKFFPDKVHYGVVRVLRKLATARTVMKLADLYRRDS